MLFGKRFLQKMEYKFRRYAVTNLMSIIIFGMALVVVFDGLSFASIGAPMEGALMFNRQAIMQGQIWRIITFIFIPIPSSLLFIVFVLYFYWLIGQTLEREWGAFKFNVFYFSGVIFAAIPGFIFGGTTNYYLNMSLFFAFALLYPNFQLLLFFIIPIKIKVLAIIDAVLFAIDLFSPKTPVYRKAALLLAVLNIIIFFGGDFFTTVRNMRRKQRWTSGRF